MMSKDWINFPEDEDEDAIFSRIQEESLRHYREVELPRRVLSSGSVDNSQTNNYGGETSSNNRENPLHTQSENILLSENDIFYRGPESGSKGFHLAAGETYIYPTNYPLREYQVNIVRSALFHNTLVCLPTGLGKTFIAAVVMYNYYRWFPQGKIVFMAPTRPLVAQQIRACHDIMAIPQEDTIEMTGTLNPIERVAYWKSRRVFFLTPQVLANDLRSNVCPALSFKCVVVDEAHRATKEYSYCQVVKALEDAGATFRMLALSATPGNNVKGVVEVLKNLRISKLEIRGDESLDVAKYTHTKNVQPIIVQLNEEILNVRETFLNIFEKYSRSLREARIITTNVNNMTKFQLLKAGEKIKSRTPNGMTKTTTGYLISDMAVCMSLAHALELLQIYGLRAFQHYLTAGSEEDKSTAAFTRLKKDGDLHELLDTLQKMLSGTEKKIWSHPKLERMVDVIKDHFSSSEENKNTKAIIFCQYRIVVCEVYDILQKIDPAIKPIMFVGQSSSRKKCGLPQKKQLEIMKSFRTGEYNVLIATCVAEEGLDIGFVDLLILMEAHRSPVRLVQRLGRTGRHRKGHCVVLLTQGKEVQKFKEAMETRKSYIRTMMNSPVILANMYDNEPKMLPSGVHPKQQLLHIRVAERVTPGKPKRQTDIRNTFSTKETCIQPPKSSFLSPDRIVQVAQELGTTNINFDRINLSNKHYLWNRTKESTMNSEEVFTTSYSYLSDWNDWNRTLQTTFEMGHSLDSEILCHLLQKADLVQVHEQPIIGLDSQVCGTQLLKIKDITNKKKKKGDKLNLKNAAESNKNDRTNPKMDIRNCLALAEERTISMQKKLLDEFNMLSQKNKLDKTIIDESVSISESEVLKSPDLCDDDVFIRSENVCNETKCEQNSLCLFSDNPDLKRIVTHVLSPTPVVKPTSTKFNVTNAINLDHFKSDITLEVIQNFNINKTFNKIKSVGCENMFVKHKLMARALVDIKNTRIHSQSQFILPQTSIVTNSKHKEHKTTNKDLYNYILVDESHKSGKIQSHLQSEFGLLHSGCEDNINKQHKNISQIDPSSVIFDRENIRCQSKLSTIKRTELIENFQNISENKNRLPHITDSKNVILSQEEDMLLYSVDVSKCHKTNEVLLNKDLLSLSNIDIDNKNQLKHTDSIKSMIEMDTGNKTTTPKSQSKKSLSSDILDLDDLLTEEVKNEMENTLFETTPGSSRKKIRVEHKHKSNDENNYSSNLLCIKECPSSQYSQINEKQESNKQKIVQPLLETDYVGIDELFDDDDDVDFNLSSTNNTRKAQHNVNHSTPNNLICSNGKNNISNHHRTSTPQTKLTLSKGIINSKFFRSSQLSRCSSEKSKVFANKIPKEKKHFNVVKVDSHNTSDDSHSDFELSPILSGRPSQMNTTICSSPKLRIQNLFPEDKPSQILKENSVQPNKCSLNLKNKNDVHVDLSNQIKNNFCNEKLEEEIKNNSDDWSVSQLFEDSDGDEKCDDKDYSMYTISQLVKKASDISVNKHKEIFQISNKKYKSNDLQTNTSVSNVCGFDASVDDIFDDVDTKSKIDAKNKLINYENNYLIHEASSSKVSPSNMKNVLNRNSGIQNLKPNAELMQQANSEKQRNSSCKLEKSNLNVLGNDFKYCEERKSFLLNQSSHYPILCESMQTTFYESSSPSKMIFMNSEKYKTEPLISSGCLSAKRVSTPLKGGVKLCSSDWLNCTDSDTNSDIFESHNNDQKIKIVKKNSKLGKRKKTKKRAQGEKNAFVIKEADVSGPQMSSDEENTSGLDDLDESFIDDFTQRSSTSANQTILDMKAVYLQAARSPVRRSGCFKIPNVRSSMLEMDVFSQSVIEDPGSYVNDSFCVEEAEIIDTDLSILEVAEQVLESKKTKRKRRKRKREASSDSNIKKKSARKITPFNESLLVRKKKICRIVSDSETDMGSEIDL